MKHQAPRSGQPLTTETVKALQGKGYKVGGVLRHSLSDSSIEREFRSFNFSSAVDAARLKGHDVVVVANSFGEDWMYREPSPQTFQIRLCRPFGTLTHHAYIFNLHAGSRHEALSWVERIFAGIDTRPTLHRWSGGSVPRIGNSDPVSITDCDRFTSSTRVGGRIVRNKAVVGEFRRTADEVYAGLVKIREHLADEHKRKVASFRDMVTSYQREPTQWVYERLQELKQCAETADLWRANLDAELERMRPQLHSKMLELPQVLHQKAA